MVLEAGSGLGAESSQAVLAPPLGAGGGVSSGRLHQARQPLARQRLALKDLINAKVTKCVTNSRGGGGGEN